MKSYYLAKILQKLSISSFNHCDIDKSAKVNYGCTMAKVKLGRYSYIGAKTRITDAIIGKFCSIGGNCGIGGGAHPMTNVSTSSAFLKGRNILGKNFADFDYDASDTVNIGNDVWIGEGVYIKGGVTIGNGAIIGAHAVVTHDVAPYAVVAGVPAREIRKRFDDETIKDLQRLAWWDWPEEKLSKYGQYFNDPAKLIAKVEE